MCKSKKGLHKIKSELILFEYRHNGTITQEDSFCCNKHFENNGEIKHEEFIKIPKKNDLFDNDAIRIIDLS
jgi:hypothetical protein